MRKTANTEPLASAKRIVSTTKPDVNGDEVVNVLDLIDLLLAFGSTCDVECCLGLLGTLILHSARGGEQGFESPWGRSPSRKIWSLSGPPGPSRLTDPQRTRQRP